MDLITIDQARARLALRTERAARKLLERLGVLSYPYGRGRSMGHRWDWIEIQAALKEMRERAHAKEQRKGQVKARTKRSATATFQGSWKDAQARIAKRGRLQ